jgi:hypothetical protein
VSGRSVAGSLTHKRQVEFPIFTARRFNASPHPCWTTSTNEWLE